MIAIFSLGLMMISLWVSIIGMLRIKLKGRIIRNNTILIISKNRIRVRIGYLNQLRAIRNHILHILISSVLKKHKNWKNLPVFINLLSYAQPLVRKNYKNSKRNSMTLITVILQYFEVLLSKVIAQEVVNSKIYIRMYRSSLVKSLKAIKDTTIKKIQWNQE